MGMVYENHGIITIEGRRESFYVHASYGLKPLECELGEVKLGYCFRDSTDHNPLQVVGHLIGKTLVKPVSTTMDGPGIERRPDDVVIPVGPAPAYEPIDQQEWDHPLRRVWREHPHPEFDLDDLDDLIRALTDYREELRK